MMTREMTLTSPEQTLALGRSLGEALIAAAPEPGALVALHGPLGAGKTQLAKGIFGAWGVDPERVKSPSFSLINEYGEGLRHLDLYRLEGERQVLGLGVLEMIEDGRLCVLEWAQRFDLFARYEYSHLRVEIDYAEHGDERRVALAAHGKPYDEAVAQAIAAG